MLSGRRTNQQNKYMLWAGYTSPPSPRFHLADDSAMLTARVNRADITWTALFKP
jgi:hypothetical protein